MSWLNKFFDLFLGEKEEEHELEPNTHAQVPKEHIPDQPEGKLTRMEDPKIYYEYPKGNFRFPVVPDGYKRTEQRQQERHERRRQPSRGYAAAKEHTERKEHTYKEPDTVKKPFKPSSIPSPVYGFQSQHSIKKAPNPQKQREESVTLLSEEQFDPPKSGQETEKEPVFTASGLTKQTNTRPEPLTKQETDEYPAAKQEQLHSETEAEEQVYRASEPPQSEDSQQTESAVPAGYPEEQEHEQTEPSIKEPEYEAPLPAEHTEDQAPPQEEYQQPEPEKARPFETAEEPVYTYSEEQEEVQPQSEDRPELPEADVKQEADPQPEYNDAPQQSEPELEPVNIETADAPARPAEEKTDHTAQPARRADRPRERNVPFNVMMLKSDKHKQTKTPEGGAGYVFPNLSLLDVPPAQRQDDQSWIEGQRELLNVTLKNFNVRAQVVHVTQGPSVTRFEVHPEPGVKVNKITNLADDIKLSLSAKDIRIEAPIPGKNTIGIEVPNRVSKVVDLRQMIRSAAFRENPSPLTAALGVDISGNPVVIDLKKMPHGLIAGATGSGKSVCINTILVSLLYKADPSDVKVLLIDPKMVELAPYNQIPHLVSPVITDAKAATAALKWVVEEMERRYELFAHSGVRDIGRFNELTADHKTGEKLPYLVVVIDELADLMMVAPNDVEESIARIAQKARACGIHLLVATQRPSVDVITGMIKANIPTRIAFSVSSQVDSRTIIDMAGAEKLLGKGDMLYWENGTGKPVRLQGNFVSDREIDRVVSHVRKQLPPSYLFEQEELIRQGTALKEEDELFPEACQFVVEQNSASTSSLQRRFRIGYNRAARLIDMMEAEGMISEAKGSKPREVLITAADISQE
ncbi:MULTISPECIES: DNA translocase FtsK [Bacillus]|jgi:S-DNA-T family DNA segregation ATPase FtsK/SpoIIIE|uniref:DNA translocase stage III sporulation protein (Modular protein) n=1 Tax=Bacillus amyloliquefaciens (strain ATCC 23350 / DSM 7 / BCRC 11601 / CCUG 28519 / NBRC 15535 / NRRL B-14393 / F) TaxID=692420 RepID=A0A9P1JIV4_BACAS|nr:DNA translocase FtsK [Bacillus amyloliquefaciens]AIW34781.1 cell division protein FtsK [Bacillus subtilis]AEB25093.1 DNA translocase stage III sporulation protein (modular protein) [Bacillus amyloliquefaciens TA208]AEB64603.1 putative DNA translocase stage III sporulation protein (modular protein) [Bacillus amyloliquefaciens LL3]AEK90128.1 putative DNA translocase stage III sporulation protein [Bacillus amyloliquefaciens XH7]ARW40105.1 DNA translocase SftA [Bacillus amyloliquefaciens]